MLPDAGIIHQSSAAHATTDSVMKPPFVLVDPGILPLVVHLDLANAYRVYLIASYLNAERFNGRGWVTYSELTAGLREFGVEYTKCKHILEKGKSIFWKLCKTRIRLTAHALKLLGKLSSRIHPDMLDACRPSKLRVWVDVSGTIADFEARLYAVWIDNRKSSSGMQVSRIFLCKLWNRSKMTLLDWEKRAGVRVTPTYAQYGGENPVLVPDHAFPYAAKDYNGNQVFRAAWQHTNIYHAGKPTKEHYSVGQQRKARKLHKKLLEHNQPPIHWGGGLADTGRLYFENGHNTLAPKCIRRHLRKHHDIQTRHYFSLGIKRTKKGKIQIMECYDNYTDLTHTTLRERDYHAEYSGNFRSLSLAFMEFGFTVLLNQKPCRKKTGHTTWGVRGVQEYVDPLVILAVEMGAVIAPAVDRSRFTVDPTRYRTFPSVLRETDTVLRRFCSLSRKLGKKVDYRALWREIYALPDIAALDARRADLEASMVILEAKKARRDRFLKCHFQNQK